jgi:putative transposase
MLHITLNDTQVAELRQLARQAVGRVSERAHFVLLSHQGYSPPEIGRLMGYDAVTVRTWLKAYRTHQCAGLDDAPRSGRPAQAPDLVAIVQAQTSQSPPTMGYLQACWTVALLVLHVCQRLRIQVSPTTMRRALHAASLVWKRPKLAPARRPDPHAAEKQAKLAEILGDSEGTIIAEDEADVHLLAVVRSMWQRIGEQKRIPTPGQNAKRGVFGGLNLRTGEWFYHITARKRGVEFIAFLTALLTAYPTGLIYVIVDNASIHTSRAVKHWLTLHTRLQLVYLPTYSGHRLNPVEKVWWDLKDDIAANRCFRSLVELEQAVQRYFAAFTQERALRLTNCEVTRTVQQALVKK